MTQTSYEFSVVIVDDGELDITQHNLCVSGIAQLREKVDVVIHRTSGRLGLAKCRNIASDLSPSNIVMKMDDDHFCDSNFVSLMNDSFKDHPEAGCIGCVFPFVRSGISVTDSIPEKFGILSESGWEEQQQQLYPGYDNNVIEAFSVRGIMGYRKVPEIRHNENLSKISHREDTIFSLEYISHGFKNYVNIRAIAYHLYSTVGGCRSFDSDETYKQRQADEEIYRQFLADMEM